MPGIDATLIVEPVRTTPGASSPAPANGSGSGADSSFRDALSQASPAKAEPKPGTGTPPPVDESVEKQDVPQVLPSEEKDTPEGAAIAALGAALVESNLPQVVPVQKPSDAPARPVEGQSLGAVSTARVDPPQLDSESSIRFESFDSIANDSGRAETVPEEARAPDQEEPEPTVSPHQSTRVGTPPVEITAHWNAFEAVDTPADEVPPEAQPLPPDKVPVDDSRAARPTPPPEIFASLAPPEAPKAIRALPTADAPRVETVPVVQDEVLTVVPAAAALATAPTVKPEVTLEVDGAPETVQQVEIPSEDDSDFIGSFGAVSEPGDQTEEQDEVTHSRETRHQALPMRRKSARGDGEEHLPEAVPVADTTAVRSTSAPRETAIRSDARMIDHVAPQIATGIHTAATTGQGIRLQLDPPDLGRVQVDVMLSQGTVTARLGAESASTQRLLLENLPQLRDALTQQGVALDRLVVETRGDSLRSDVSDRSFSQSQQQSGQENAREWFFDDAETPRESRRARVRGPGRLDVQV